MEVYIYDIIVKSQSFNDHLLNGFLIMRKHQLNMNHLKCAFNVNTDNFLGFLVYNQGIEVDQNKTKAIIQNKPPSTKKKLQRLLGHINFLRHFILNVAGKMKVFLPLLRIKGNKEF